MLHFNEPKNRSMPDLLKLLNDALAYNETMIGDLTKEDAIFLASRLEAMGYSTKIETDSDATGTAVESANWKILHFTK